MPLFIVATNNVMFGRTKFFVLATPSINVAQDVVSSILPVGEHITDSNRLNSFLDGEVSYIEVAIEEDGHPLPKKRKYGQSKRSYSRYSRRG